MDAGPAAPPPVTVARLSRRLQAAVVDWTVYFTMPSVAAFVALVAADGRPQRTLVWGLVTAAVLYEPVLVAWRGATIGHAAKGLRVVDAATGRPPAFARAFGRFVAKVLTGPLTAPMVSLTRRHQALHDLLFDTIVEARAGSHGDAGRNGYGPAAARPPLTAGRLARRLAVTLAWSVLAWAVAVFLTQAFVSDDCALAGACAPGEILFAGLVITAALATQYALLWFGLAGRLHGARG